MSEQRWSYIARGKDGVACCAVVDVPEAKPAKYVFKWMR
jgi:hypothetical protein